MSPYWFIAFIAWTVIMVGAGYEGRGWEDKAATEDADLRASIHKNKVQSESSTINQGAENAYNSQKTADDALYNAPVGLPNNVNNLPQVSKPTCGIKPTSCITRKYKLTLLQCDGAKDGYIDLWDAWVAQEAIK